LAGWLYGYAGAGVSYSLATVFTIVTCALLWPIRTVRSVNDSRTGA
jgi:hypothetical protein